VSREAHAGICESRGAKLPPATRPAGSLPSQVRPRDVTFKGYGEVANGIESCPRYEPATVRTFVPERSMSPFRQNAIATHSGRASENGRQQSIAGGGEYRLGLRADAIDTVRASRRVGRADASTQRPGRS
jgi:hypothetical protein